MLVAAYRVRREFRPDVTGFYDDFDIFERRTREQSAEFPNMR